MGKFMVAAGVVVANQVASAITAILLLLVGKWVTKLVGLD